MTAEVPAREFPTAPAQTVCFRASAELLRDLDARGAPSRGRAVREFLDWYLPLVAQERTRLLRQFGSAELHALLDVTNGWYVTPEAAPLLWAEVEDACRLDGLAGRWEIDGAALVAKLRALSPIQAGVLVDALRQAWRTPDPFATLTAWRAGAGPGALPAAPVAASSAEPAEPAGNPEP